MTDEQRQAFKADMKAKKAANGEKSEGGKKGKCDKKKKGSAKTK